MSIHITKNFTLGELTYSETAVRKGIYNFPLGENLFSLCELTENILQPCRDMFGPIRITSGYRSPELNEAIGGSVNSQHSKGQAVDFKIPGHSNYEVCKWIMKSLEFDQLIYEFGEDGWIHCSYKVEENRRSILTAVKHNNKTIYKNGLVQV